MALELDCTVRTAYPATRRERDRWIWERRPEPMPGEPDPTRPYAFFREWERTEAGRIVGLATVFLTSRECPWRCLMCDLWKNTSRKSLPQGAIPAQIDFALSQMQTGDRQGGNEGSWGNVFKAPVNAARFPAPQHLKLYNNGSFFDHRAIPPSDYPSIVSRLLGFERVIVECHPALVGDSLWQFRDLLQAGNPDLTLEVAMGLETAHEEVLEKLNKGITLEQFRTAARLLGKEGVALRVFVLVQPPFLNERTGLVWAKRSLDVAFEIGATVVCLIPTRPGNGALEALAQQGLFSPPRLATLEAAAEYGIGTKRGRVFADLWDVERFSDCPNCFAKRAKRLAQMNLSQKVPRPVACEICGHGLNQDDTGRD